MPTVTAPSPQRRAAPKKRTARSLDVNEKLLAATVRRQVDVVGIENWLWKETRDALRPKLDRIVGALRKAARPKTPRDARRLADRVGRDVSKAFVDVGSGLGESLLAVGLANYARTGIDFARVVPPPVLRWLAKVPLMEARFNWKDKYGKRWDDVIGKGLGADHKPTGDERLFFDHVFEPPEEATLNRVVIPKRAESLFRIAAHKVAIPQIRISITQGMLAGEGMADIADRVARILAGRPAYHVERIVRTEAMRASVAMQQQACSRFKDVLKGQQHVATLDARTCEVCGNLDGKVYPPDVPDQVTPPLHPMCRCTLSPVTKSWREFGIPINDVPPGQRPYVVNGMCGVLPKPLTYREWFGTLDADTQLGILGPGRFALYKGGMPLSRFVNNKNRLVPIRKLLA